MKNILDKSCRGNQNILLCSTTFFRKSCRLWDNVGKYGRMRQITVGNITQRLRIALWINMARIQTHTQNI